MRPINSHKQYKMKKIALVLVACCTLVALNAQDNAAKNGKTRGRSLGIHFNLNDFVSGRALDTAKIGDVLDAKQWYKPSQMATGFGISYGAGITPKIDLRSTLGVSFVDYLFKNKPRTGVNDILTSLDVSGEFRALSDNYMLNPYLNAGVGLSYWRGYLGAIAPVGLGLQLNLKNASYIDLKTQMRLGLTDNTTNQLYHSLGFIGNLEKVVKKPKPVIVPKPPIVPKRLDADGDGILDTQDACPMVAGKAELNGCPDGDNDGIADKDDNCPTKAGVAKYQGCPVPDSDGDGILDDVDACPNMKGLPKFQGCPEPDADGDGVTDSYDKCPTVPGSTENNGCPEVEKVITKKELGFIAQNILFETSSAKLRTVSYSGLNQVAKLMAENPELKLNIDGHTDNKGNAESNMILSQKRADAVKAYLESRGISADRMTATGHGQEEPVSDNETAEGRQENRRVELKLGY